MSVMRIEISPETTFRKKENDNQMKALPYCSFLMNSKQTCDKFFVLHDNMIMK